MEYKPGDLFKYTLSGNVCVLTNIESNGDIELVDIKTNDIYSPHSTGERVNCYSLAKLEHDITNNFIIKLSKLEIAIYQLQSKEQKD